MVRGSEPNSFREFRLSDRLKAGLVVHRWSALGYTRCVDSQAILIIDDDEGLRTASALLLEQEGFHVLTAADGRTGYDMGLNMHPDLMIVDLRLPGMSGIEICRQIRGAGLKTPLIVLSAVGDEIDKVLLLEIGADDLTMVKALRDTRVARPHPGSPAAFGARARALGSVSATISVDLDRPDCDARRRRGEVHPGRIQPC